MQTTCPTTQHFSKLSHQQLVAILVALEDVVFDQHLNIDCDRVTKKSMQAFVDQLHSTLYPA